MNHIENIAYFVMKLHITYRIFLVVNCFLWILQNIGETRLDNTRPIKTLYGSRRGQDIRLDVAVPVMANPPPQESMITWFGPVANVSITSTVSQQYVSYKHWINSSIPIIDQEYYGNYTLKYNGSAIISVIINTEGLYPVLFIIIFQNNYKIFLNIICESFWWNVMCSNPKSCRKCNNSEKFNNLEIKFNLFWGFNVT